MKRFLIVLYSCIILLAIHACSPDQAVTADVPPYSTFYKVKISDVQPEGWIREFLERQKSGLTGHIEVAGYPFNTCMWGCEKMEGSYKEWWPYEQTAYYLDGAFRLGLLLNDEELLEKARSNMEYVMEHIDSTGRVSTQLADRWWRWPYASFFRLFMTEYQETGDRTYVEALHNHYLTFTANDFADDLELANVEELCWIYGKTGDQRMLDTAEEAYRLFNSSIENRNRAGADMQFASDRIPDHHAVVYLELVKIPAILYSYTGNENYLNDAIHGIEKMEKYHMLIAGLPSSTEHFTGTSELSGTETCNTAVFPYTYGHMLRITGEANLGDKIERAVFNGGIGAITKDFKAHQYFSAPNQFIATLTSNDYGHHPARMAFAPGHDVECCTGNVNRFMPYYVEQMWLKTQDHGLVAALFGPCSVRAEAGKKSVLLTIVEETDYPFSERIDFKIQTRESVTFPLYIRIPQWCDAAEILVNGEIQQQDITPGTFYKLEREFSDGDIITLNIPMHVITSSWGENGIGVERGPLVFSYPITGEASIARDYERSTREFPAYEFTPAVEWNYALSLAKGEIHTSIHEIKGYPWSEGNSPVKLKVPVRKIKNWSLETAYDKNLNAETLKTPAFPDSMVLETEIQYIELVPYGSTLLRLTLFPEDQ